MTLQLIQTRIAQALTRAGRPEDAVTLIAVSKVQPEDRVRAVLDAGQRCILNTELANPTPHGVYRRIGYRAVAESLRYEFTTPAD